ncbi:MAG: hypothetical protein DMF24_10175 [Verrucomicrobia bacterium]|nr:MAG: hypothetical protein DMF24_10175 [Verrucomicrobiota bacterium]
MGAVGFEPVSPPQFRGKFNRRVSQRFSCSVLDEEYVFELRGRRGEARFDLAELHRVIRGTGRSYTTGVTASAIEIEKKGRLAPALRC